MKYCKSTRPALAHQLHHCWKRNKHPGKCACFSVGCTVTWWKRGQSPKVPK